MDADADPAALKPTDSDSCFLLKVKKEFHLLPPAPARPKVGSTVRYN